MHRINAEEAVKAIVSVSPSYAGPCTMYYLREEHDLHRQCDRSVHDDDGDDEISWRFVVRVLRESRCQQRNGLAPQYRSRLTAARTGYTLRTLRDRVSAANDQRRVTGRPHRKNPDEAAAAPTRTHLKMGTGMMHKIWTRHPFQPTGFSRTACLAVTHGHRHKRRHAIAPHTQRLNDRPLSSLRLVTSLPSNVLGRCPEQRWEAQTVCVHERDDHRQEREVLLGCVVGRQVR